MADTSNLGLPLVQAAQAQKHITVNEALVRLDGLTQLALGSRQLTSPPASAADGDTWAVPAGGLGLWAGQDGRLAVFSNGGWVFADPRRGWSAYILDEGARALFDGRDWISGAQTVSPSGAAARFETIEIDHSVAPGAVSATVTAIPANTLVFGISGAVSEAMTGPLTSWQLGVPGAPDRYGAGLGTAEGSFAMGLTGSPVAYYTDTPLELTAEGGTFAGGRVTLAVHLFAMTVPAA
ncbi:MAG: DUF2793 domain-containing protein [Pseudomonadota bacterium]